MTVPSVHNTLYGYNAHNMDFPARSRSGWTTLPPLRRRRRHSLAHQGFRRIFLVNAHGRTGRCATSPPGKVTLDSEACCGSINHWELGWDMIAAQLEGGPYAADHACEWETSEYLASRPSWCRREKIQDEIPAERGGPRWLYPGLQGAKRVHFMNWWSRMNDCGVAGTPTLATAEKGRAMFEGDHRAADRGAREFRLMPDWPRHDHRVEAPPVPKG